MTQASLGEVNDAIKGRQCLGREFLGKSLATVANGVVHCSILATKKIKIKIKIK